MPTKTKSGVASDRFHRSAINGTKRARTMARLMDAAVNLFAERGVEATSVLEITSRAGVSNGTFYSYFETKGHIVDAVYERVTDALVSNIIYALDRIDHGPTQIVLGSIWFTDAVSSEPHWGWMVVKALEERTPFRDTCSQTIAGYIANGLRQELFHIVCTQTVLDMVLAVLIEAIKLRLEKRTPESTRAGIVAAEMHLRMLGMSSEDARTIPEAALSAHGGHPAITMPDMTPASPRHPSFKSHQARIGRETAD